MTDVQLHAKVKAALDAWQDKKLDVWLSHFSDKAQLFDDGAPRDFRAFSADIGKERFTHLDNSADEGMTVFGRFHSDKWGDFKTVFKFRLDNSGRFDRLDIGEADY